MKRFKVLWIILAIILVLIGGGVGFAYYWIDSTLGKMELTEKIDKEEAGIEKGLLEKEKNSQVINIAVFGIDKNGDETDGRSDAIKILSLDTQNNEAKITSLQRDTLIYIPGVKQDFEKLNHAYAYGGANLALQTINYNFDLDVTRYVAFNFEAVEHVIDAIGGIELEIQEGEVPFIAEVTHSGYQHLDGKQALGYMRLRYSDNDYVRMDRQTAVMQAMFSKLSSLNYSQILELINECLPYVETNISTNEMLSLGMKALKLDPANIQTHQIPRGSGETVNQSVTYNGYSPLYIVDSYQQLVKDVHEDIYGESNYEPSQRVKDMEATIYEKFGYIEK